MNCVCVYIKIVRMYSCRPYINKIQDIYGKYTFTKLTDFYFFVYSSNHHLIIDKNLWDPARLKN